jgi:hypothetical protein
MTTKDLPTEENSPKAVAKPAIITDPPADIPAQLVMHAPASAAQVGVPTSVKVTTAPGTRFVWNFQTRQWEGTDAFPTYTNIELSIGWQNSSDQYLTAITNYPGSTTTFPQTFTRAVDYTISAVATTSNGTQYHASGIVFHVSPAGPPDFTISAPANGATVPLGPNGAPVTVQLSSAAGQLYPFAVRIDHDGVSTSGQYNGTSYSSTFTLNAAPVGARTISVTCTDSANHPTTKSITLNTTDGAPPTVTLGAYQADVKVTSLPYVFVLTGTTPGASSGVTGVSYNVPDVASGSAVDTSSGHDWSQWRIEVPLVTTGGYNFSVTATDTRGTTSTKTGNVNVHL